MSNDKSLGVILGFGSTLVAGIVLWFSGLLTLGMEAKILDNLKKDDTYVSHITTKFAESAPFRSLQESVTAIRETNLKILQTVNALETRIVMLEADKWQRQASALGIRNPNIQSISLAPQQQFSSATQGRGKQTIKIDYTIVRIEQNRLIIKMDAWIDGKKNFYDNFIVLEPLTPGKVFDLSRYVQIPGAPALRLAILARPLNDRLIIATDGLGTPKETS